MSKVRRVPAVAVRWNDAASHETGWIKPAEIPKNMLGVKSVSVGFLLRKSRSEVVLAMNSSENGTYADLMVVPRCLVTSIKRLNLG